MGLQLYINTNTSGESSVYARLYFNEKTVKYYPGILINAKHWDKKKQRMKLNSAEAYQVNDRLEQIEKTILSLVENYKHQGITPDSKRLKIDVERTIYSSSGDKKVFDALNEFIASKEKVLSDSIVNRLKAVQKHLEEIQVISGTLNWDSFNLNFYDTYLNHLNSKNLSKNTQGGRIKALKSFLNWAFENEYHKNIQFKKYKFLQEEVAHVILSEEELMHLYNFPFTKDSMMAKVRDRFCFRCFTGLRVSDLSKLNPASITNEYIEITTTKTNDCLDIPLNKFSREILAKLTSDQDWFSQMTTDDENQHRTHI